MKYQYTGMTQDRQEVKGSVDASDEAEAKIRLYSMKIRPTSLKAIRVQSDFFKKFALGSPVDLKGLIVFTRQLSSLVDSGVPLVAALGVLHEQERKPAFKAILGEIKEGIESGQGLSEMLQRYPRVFSEFFVRVVEAGEVSGTLDKSLIRVGKQLEKLSALKRKVIGAMTYPCITLLIAIVVIFFMLWKVVPEITKLYGGSKLPDLTLAIISISTWVQSNVVSIFVGTIALVVGTICALRMPGVRLFVDPLLLKIPALGLLIVRSGVANFARTLSTLVSSGVPLLVAFQICEKVSANTVIKACVRDAAESVTEGKGIHVGLAKRGIFPPMVIHMVSIGEMTGRLDELLEKVADIFDEEVDDAVGLMTTLLQPLLIVFVGIVISFIMIAMYLPIFSMSEKVSGV